MDTSVSPNRLTGRKIILIFLVWFGVVGTVDGIFATQAVTSFSGLSAEHYYERGIKYNEILAAAAAQEKLGWHASLAYLPKDGVTGQIRFSLADRDGHPLNGAAVDAHFVRPTMEGHDFVARLNQEEPGIYQAKVAAPMPGVWDVHISALVGGQPYRLIQRIIVH